MTTKSFTDLLKSTVNSFQALIMKDDEVDVAPVVFEYETVENLGVIAIKTTLPDGSPVSIQASFSQFQSAYSNLVSAHNEAAQKARAKQAAAAKKLKQT